MESPCFEVGTRRVSMTTSLRTSILHLEQLNFEAIYIHSRVEVIMLSRRRNHRLLDISRNSSFGCGGGKKVEISFVLDVI